MEPSGFLPLHRASCPELNKSANKATMTCFLLKFKRLFFTPVFFLAALTRAVLAHRGDRGSAQHCYIHLIQLTSDYRHLDINSCAGQKPLMLRSNVASSPSNSLISQKGKIPIYTEFEEILHKSLLPCPSCHKPLHSSKIYGR